MLSNLTLTFVRPESFNSFLLKALDKGEFPIASFKTSPFYQTSANETPRKLKFWGTFFFVFSGAAPAAYGGSQAKGLIGVVAAGLRHSSQRRQILNSLSEARNQTCNLMVPSWIR